jgi:cytochrome c peroxidase
MHDGQLATLVDVVRHYDQINLERLHADGERILEPLGLSEGERNDLGAFLQSLTAPDAAAGRGPSASAPPANRPARESARCPA